MGLRSFVTGMAVGGALVYGSLTHHVLRTENGLTTVPKLQPSFEEIYLDVRQYSISDWARHKAVAAAIVSAHKEEIFTGHASQTVSQGVGDFVREFTNLRQPAQ